MFLCQKTLMPTNLKRLTRASKRLNLLSIRQRQLGEKNTSRVPPKNGKRLMWKFETFLKMNCQARFEKARDLKLCFNCLPRKHVVKDCTYKLCGVKGYSKRHHRLLHRDTNGRTKESETEVTQQKVEPNYASCSLKSRQENDLKNAGIHGTNDGSESAYLWEFVTNR